MQQNNAIRIKIIPKTITFIEEESRISFEYSIHNRSKNTYIIYAHNITEDAISDDDLYCMENRVGGLAIGIRNQMGFKIKTMQGFKYEINAEKTEYSDVVDAFESKRTSINKNVLVIEPKTKMHFQLTHEFTHYKIHPGKFQLYVILYVGKNIDTYVSIGELEKKLMENAF
jgi:hypothetical protein